MRDFFIRSLEKLVGVVVVLLAIGVVVGAVAVLLAEPAPGQPGGVLGALAILIGGGIYVIFIGGFMYLGIGIYQNTKRMAEALDRRAL